MVFETADMDCLRTSFMIGKSCCVTANVVLVACCALTCCGESQEMVRVEMEPHWGFGAELVMKFGGSFFVPFFLCISSNIAMVRYRFQK